MRLLNLQCRNFRGLADTAFEPAPGINVLRGKNAQGKTSVLEAIVYAATAKSPRTNNEADIVRHGEEDFHVRVEADRADQRLVIEAHWWRGAKRVKVNGVAQTRLSDVLGRLHVVLFTPEDLDLVKGGAGDRRRFLDMTLAPLYPAYLAALQQYRQVLRQRNEVLRAVRLDPDLLAVWDTQLAQHGTDVMRRRHAFAEELAGAVRTAYQRIAGDEQVAVLYEPDIRAEADYMSTLEKTRAGDFKRKVTSRGPHRDDLALLVQEHPARSHGSQGQQKSLAIALKLASMHIIRNHADGWPVLLLDEVLSELDEDRARRLVDAVPADSQCIMTTTRLTPAGYEPPHTDFVIEAGVVRRM
ncbi:MAG: DNA replication/repair protein RecF [Candidatus Hydrogenedentales bacterium]